MILTIIINYVKSSKNGWAKHFFPLQRVYTRRDESWRLQSRQYLLWVFHAEIGNHKYNFHVKERKKRKIHVFANTGLWMYAGLLVPSACRSFVQNRFLLSLIRVMIWKNDICKRFFVPWQAEDIIAWCGIREITIDGLKGMKLWEKKKKKKKTYYLTSGGKMNLSDKSVLNSITSCYMFSCFLFFFPLFVFLFFFFFF